MLFSVDFESDFDLMLLLANFYFNCSHGSAFIYTLQFFFNSSHCGLNHLACSTAQFGCKGFSMLKTAKGEILILRAREKKFYLKLVVNFKSYK